MKSLLSGNHQKSIFNSAVCVRAPLNPRLYNPPRQPSLSCANKHVTDPKRGEEASVRPQSFPDGTRRRRYLHRPDSVPKVTRLERLPRDPAGFYLALISAEDLPPECATDAQMWCLSDAPPPHDKSPVSHLPTYGIPYDIPSSGRPERRTLISERRFHQREPLPFLRIVSEP